MASTFGPCNMLWHHIELHAWSDLKVSIQMTLSEVKCIGRNGHGTILRTAEFSKVRTSSLALQDWFPSAGD